MGIPSYFRYLIKEYGDIVFDIKYIEHDHIDRLFLDLNCAIHPCAKKIMDNVHYDPLKNNSFEKKIIRETINYIKKLVELVNPTELLYIAIDGVAPRAKMEQQRQRRFKAVKERRDIQKIKSKYNKNIDTCSWDKNAITPGTQFMHVLGEELKHFVMYDKLFQNLKVILSTSNVCGEGEHKILNHIRNDTKQYIDVIYGLDADLIMLSMATHNPHIYLLREALHFGKGIDVGDVDFLYLDINRLREHLLQHLSININGNFDDYEFRRNLINDYIFICFLAGNDFVPHSPTISIKDKGLELLIDIYTKIYNLHGKHLTNTDELLINHRFLQEIFRELLSVEESIFRDIEKKRARYRVYLNKCETPEERELEKLNRFPMFHRQLEKKVKLGQEGWNKRYYKYCFNKTMDEKNDICKNYIESLLWTFKYYYNGCPSWHWYYCHRHSPAFEDLYEYMNVVGDLNTITFNKAKPYKPFEQLMTVLPPASAHLHAKEYQKLIRKNDIRIVEYYPTDFKVDTLHCNFMWQCTSILPKIDDKHLLNVLRQYKHTKKEMERNKNVDIFTNFIKN